MEDDLLLSDGVRGANAVALGCVRPANARVVVSADTRKQFDCLRCRSGMPTISASIVEVRFRSSMIGIAGKDPSWARWPTARLVATEDPPSFDWMTGSSCDAGCS